MSRPPSQLKQPSCRILITGGGTGGHVFPALAVVDALQDTFSAPGDLLIEYIGNVSRMEARLVPERGLPFHGIRFAGMPAMGPGLVLWGLQFILAVCAVFPIFLRLKPQVVFATGGYVTAPVLLVALITRTPYVLHEPDAHAGKVNRLFSKWAAHVTCGFAAAKTQLETTAVTLTGNPVRMSDSMAYTRGEALSELGLRFEPSRKTLLVLGGSLGAQQINRVIAESLVDLTATLGLQVIHQVGEAHYPAYVESLPERERLREDYAAFPFIANMPAAYACADIVVCRAGALTLSELYMSGRPSLLVPYPHAAGDHQTQNARAAQDAGAARVIADADLSRDSLLKVLRDWLMAPERLEHMATASRQLARVNAAPDIVAILSRFAQSTKK